MRRHRLLAVVLVLDLAVSCSATPDTIADVSGWLGDWVLGGDTSAALSTPTLRIESDGSIVGSTGVNRYRGKLDLTELAQGRWATAPLVTTMMAGSEAAMALESRVTDALSGATDIELCDGALTLLRDGKELLRFARAQ
ncbi:MAG: META domain-containing protein [Planctomycetota bacterium]